MGEQGKMERRSRGSQGCAHLRRREPESPGILPVAMKLLHGGGVPAIEGSRRPVERILSRPQNVERAERWRARIAACRTGFAGVQPRSMSRPSSFPALCTPLSATSPSTLSSPWLRSPSPHLLPRARAEHSCPAAGAPTNLGRRSSILLAHSLLTSPSVSPAPHRTRLSPTPAGIDPVPGRPPLTPPREAPLPAAIRRLR